MKDTTEHDKSFCLQRLRIYKPRGAIKIFSNFCFEIKTQKKQKKNRLCTALKVFILL
jgi:hypothetical protein